MKKSAILLSLIVSVSAQTNYNLYFDGVNDYIEASDISFPVDSSSRSVSMWIKTVQTFGEKYFFSYGKDSPWYQRWAFGLTGGRNLIEYNGTSSESSKFVSDGKWHHVAATYDGKDVNIFVDGMKQSMSTQSAITPDTKLSGKVLIGDNSADPTGSQRFKGSIDEVSVFNKALSADEILELYESGGTLNLTSNIGDYVSSSNLVAYWRFDEGTGTTITDASGNNHTGTIYGDATWEWDPPQFDLVYPFNDTTIVLTRDNFLDTLYFAWNQPTWNQLTGRKSYKLTYKRDLTGDLTDYIKFIVPGDDPDIIVRGNSLLLDGIEGHLTVPHNDVLNLGDALTIEGWIKVNDLSGNSWDTILMKGDYGWGLAVTDTECGPGEGYLAFWKHGLCGESVFSSKTIVTQEWVHVAVVVDSTGTEFYIDGESAGSDPNTTINDNNASLIIGHQGIGCACSLFNGNIDQLIIWNVARTQLEIKGSMRNGIKEENSLGLIAYWEFNEGTGLTAADSSGNENNAELYHSGVTWETDSHFKPLVSNMFKIPHHHIEHYMHTAGIEIAQGTWDVFASDGESSTPSSNGPFTLTIDASALSSDETGLVPQEFALHQNYPNPFNPTTTISYDLPEQAQVTLGIYDILGKQIKTLVNQSQDAGNKIAVWNGTDNLGRQVSAGVYLYQIQAGDFTQTRKMLLLK